MSEDRRRNDGEGGGRGEGESSRSVENRLRITLAGELLEAVVVAARVDGRGGSFGCSESAGGVEVGEAMVM
jgi:hypothetical protein